MSYMATTLVPGHNGLEKVVIDTPYGLAEVYRLGACLTRYQAKGPNRAREVLFLSKTSHFTVGKPIRGGVPICWPWFGPHATDPTLPAHGLVRTKEWTVSSTTEDSVILETVSDDSTRAAFPHAFKLIFRVKVADYGLLMELETRNQGNEPFSIGEALHTYFQVGDIRQTQTTGLKGLTYVDKVDGLKLKTESEEAVPVNGETDRVYRGATGPHEIRCPAGNILVSKSGSADTVYWNPWEKKAESLADLAGSQWPEFVCVEAVNTGDNSVKIAPGTSHILACMIKAL